MVVVMRRRKDVGGVADEAVQGKNVRKSKGGASSAFPSCETRPNARKGRVCVAAVCSSKQPTAAAGTTNQ